MRATTFASMDTPGPFERAAKEAYFNVTLPGAKDTAEEIEGRMAGVQCGDDREHVRRTKRIRDTTCNFLWVHEAPTQGAECC